MAPISSIAFNQQEIENDLAYWEFVNASDAESNDDVWSTSNFSSDSETTPTLVVVAQDVVVQKKQNDIDDDVDIDENDDGDEKRFIVGQYDDNNNDDESDASDDDELDDELVPRYVSGKFGRQRMRKLGKRGFAKMNNSKRLPYSFVKPGCVYGKHGLGLKHNC